MPVPPQEFHLLAPARQEHEYAARECIAREQRRHQVISKNSNFVILSEAKNLFFRERKKQILRPGLTLLSYCGR